MKTTSALICLIGAGMIFLQCGRAHSAELNLGDFSGVIDARLYSGGGDTWVNGGEGKGEYTRSSGLRLGEAVLVWSPRLTKDVGFHVSGSAAPGNSGRVDLMEAYASYKAPTIAGSDLTFRAGTFFPRISLEHDDLSWSTIHTITPSAINTWVSEEIKLAGAEVSVTHAVGAGSLEVSATLFGHDDTAGAMLAYHGWTLHDLKAGLSTKWTFPRSELRTLYPRQPTFSAASRSVNGAIGELVQTGFRTPSVYVGLLHYRNGGDRTSSTRGQYSWATQFSEAVGSWAIRPSTTVYAQYLLGDTKMGPYLPPIVVNAAFSSAYLMVTQAVGKDEISSRIETFRVHDRTFVAVDNQNENGHAETIDYIHNIDGRIQIRLELEKISSARPMRLFVSTPERQSQVIGQMAVRYNF
jgi:hypothetical protein